MGLVQVWPGLKPAHYGEYACLLLRLSLLSGCLRGVCVDSNGEKTQLKVSGTKDLGRNWRANGKTETDCPFLHFC